MRKKISNVSLPPLQLTDQDQLIKNKKRVKRKSSQNLCESDNRGLMNYIASIKSTKKQNLLKISLIPQRLIQLIMKIYLLMAMGRLVEIFVMLIMLYKLISLPPLVHLNLKIISTMQLLETEQVLINYLRSLSLRLSKKEHSIAKHQSIEILELEM